MSEPPIVLRSEGICPACGAQAVFSSNDPWLRNHYLCDQCGSLPRERALAAAIEKLAPNWRTLQIHETSPVFRATSKRLRTECPGFSFSRYSETIERGGRHPTIGWRNEDLEQMTFADASFDLFLAQDVFEHLFDPARAISEIARVLRPGGALIMTVPLVQGDQPSQRRARRDESGIEYLKPQEFHGNPSDPNGSLVTVDWGYDILAFIAANAPLSPMMFFFDDVTRGLRAELMEVVAAVKQRTPDV